MNGRNLWRLKSWSTVITLVALIGLVVSLVRFFHTASQPALDIGTVALGSTTAALAVAIGAAGVLLTVDNRLSKRLRRAETILAGSNTQAVLQSPSDKYDTQRFDSLLTAVVDDAAAELTVAQSGLTAQILLLVGGGDQPGEFIWPPPKTEQAQNMASAGRHAVAKGSAILREPEADPESTSYWVVSVPIPAASGSPPLGAVTLSGAYGSLGTALSSEGLQPVVSLLLSWGRVAALQIGEG